MKKVFLSLVLALMETNIEFVFVNQSEQGALFVIEHNLILIKANNKKFDFIDKTTNEVIAKNTNIKDALTAFQIYDLITKTSIII